MDYEKEINELKEKLARRGVKIRELEHKMIVLEKEQLDQSKDLHNHKQNEYAHQS